MARHDVVLEGRSVVLKPLEEGHLPLTLQWRNQERVRWCFINPAIIGEDAHRKWFAAYLDRDEFMFVILEKARQERPVGQLGLYRIDRVRKTAEFGRLMIGLDDALRKGLAREATQLVLAYGFDTLGLDEITVEVLIGNFPALAIYRSLGFLNLRRTNTTVFMVLQKRGHVHERPVLGTVE